MVVAVLLAVANIVFDLDPNLVIEVLENVLVLGGAAIARQRVTPTRKLTAERVRNLSQNDD